MKIEFYQIKAISLAMVIFLALFGFSESSFAQPKPLSNGIVFNPLGFLQFGPIVQGEFKVGPSTMIGPHVRFSGLGLLYHLVVEYDQTDFTSMAFGMDCKQFFGPKTSANKFYVGGLMEYGWGTGTNDSEIFVYDPNSGVSYWKDVNAKMKHTYLSFTANGGYRWRFSKMSLSVGLLAGFAQELTDERTSPNPTKFSEDIRAFAMAELGLGFEF